MPRFRSIPRPHFALFLTLSLTPHPASAQTPPDASIPAAIRSLSDRAGIVFGGEVTAIRPLGGVVEVEFRVDRTFKGQPTPTAILREWAGLWASGERRYWLGERAVVFLHPPASSGLSSSVDGMDGILPLIAPTAADPATPPTLTADIQRLRTRVLRQVGQPLVASPGSMSLDDLATAVRDETASSSRPPVIPNPPQPQPQPQPQPGPSPLPIHGTPVILPPPSLDDPEPAPNERPSHKPARPTRLRHATL